MGRTEILDDISGVSGVSMYLFLLKICVVALECNEWCMMYDAVLHEIRFFKVDERRYIKCDATIS